MYFYAGLIAFGVFFVVHIILHEGGHLVFGLLTGYKFLSFRVFSTIIYKHNGTIRKRKFAIKGTGGQCLMYPPKRKEDGSFPFVWYNMGGGISNLFFSLIVLIPAILTENNVLLTLCIAFITAGVLIGITNLVPLNMGLQNDGMNMMQMLKDNKSRDAFYLQLRVNAEMSDGKLITDYSLSDFPLIEGENSTNMLVTFNYFYHYYIKLAEQDYEGARQILNQMIENSDKYIAAIFNMIEVERLFFMVIDKKPLEEIACVYRYLRVILNTSKTSVGIQRVHYVYEILLTENEKKDIVNLITKKPPKKWKENTKEEVYNNFLKTANNYPIIGEAKMHLDIVEYIRNNYMIDNA
ncbi:MAG: hypothetical protein K0S61_3802 [Anaerocolumna sp.]|nr:hypothetical protein [Anaerocolumna sp.]